MVNKCSTISISNKVVEEVKEEEGVKTVPAVVLLLAEFDSDPE